MLDTVCVGFNVSPTLAQLEKWSYFMSRHPNGAGKVSYRSSQENRKRGGNKGNILSIKR